MTDDNNNVENQQEENQNRQECNKKWWKNVGLKPNLRTFVVLWKKKENRKSIMSIENNENKQNIEQETENKSWWKNVGLKFNLWVTNLNSWQRDIFVKFLVIILIFLFIFNYSYIVKKITYFLEDYIYEKKDFSSVEKIIKTRIFLLNNFLGKKDNSYKTSINSLLYFYIRQWCFAEAENIQRNYISVPQNDFYKFHFYKDLSYILKKEKKFLEAKSFLEKANEINKNNNTFKYNLDEDFLLLFLEMNLQQELSDFYTRIETKKDTDKNYNYYMILKNINDNDYISAKIRIEKELVFTNRDLSLYQVAVPTKYLNIIVNEIYRNTLRKLLIKILIQENEKEEAKKILTEVYFSEKEIYGYYSPENLCNIYHMYQLDENKTEMEKMQSIASKLLLFKGENTNNYYEKIVILCK